MFSVIRHVWPYFSQAVRDGAWDLANQLFGGLPAFAASPGETIRKELWNPFKERWKEFVSNTVPSAYQEAVERSRELANSVQTAGQEVFSDIARTIRDAVGSGQIQPQTDGGLGEVHDIYTPEGDLPEIDLGNFPGISTPAAGIDRSASSPSLPPPLPSLPDNQTPLSPSTPSGPTHEDLGLEAGTYFEYQPSEGVVVITHPDGTQETRPWP